MFRFHFHNWVFYKMVEGKDGFTAILFCAECGKIKKVELKNVQ